MFSLILKNIALYTVSSHYLGHICEFIFLLQFLCYLKMEVFSWSFAGETFAWLVCPPPARSHVASMFQKLHSGVSCSAIGHVFNVNKSAM